MVIRDERNLLQKIEHFNSDSDATLDVHYDYGAYGERTLMQEKNGTTVMASTGYGYDSLKRLSTETRQFQGLAGSFSVGYSYNHVDSLTQMTYSGSSWSRTVYYGYNYTGAPSTVGTNMAPGLPFDTNVMSGFNYRAYVYSSGGQLLALQGTIADSTQTEKPHSKKVASLSWFHRTVMDSFMLWFPGGDDEIIQH